MSAATPVAVPDNYPALVERAAAEFGDAEAIRDGDMSMTFAELAARTEECAAALVANGLRPGDAVGLVGAQRLGVGGRRHGHAASRRCHRAGQHPLPGPRGRLCAVAGAGQAALHRGRLPRVRLRDRPRGRRLGRSTPSTRSNARSSCAATHRRARLRSTSSWPLPHPTASPKLRNAPPLPPATDLGLVMFTSGTTGLPKGVMIRPASIIRSFQPVRRRAGDALG